MKIWTVTFNDGGWYSSRPEYVVVANSSIDAIEKVKEKHPQYKNGYDGWAVEFKIEGYVIEVHDEKTYSRDQKLGEII